jgi:hypothetical protein
MRVSPTRTRAAATGRLSLARPRGLQHGRRRRAQHIRRAPLLCSSPRGRGARESASACAGHNFGPAALLGQVSVLIGPQPCSAVVWYSHELISCVTPPFAGSDLNIRRARIAAASPPCLTPCAQRDRGRPAGHIYAGAGRVRQRRVRGGTGRGGLTVRAAACGGPSPTGARVSQPSQVGASNCRSAPHPGSARLTRRTPSAAHAHHHASRPARGQRHGPGPHCAVPGARSRRLALASRALSRAAARQSMSVGGLPCPVTQIFDQSAFRVGRLRSPPRRE